MNKELQNRLSSGAVRVILIAIAFLWTLPSFGLLVSSFRPEDDIKQNGWWTVFQNPAQFTQQFTLENYERVLGGEGMLDAFLNSLAVSDSGYCHSHHNRCFCRVCVCVDGVPRTSGCYS